MRIASAQVAFAAQHREVQTVQQQSSFRAWVDSPTRRPPSDRVTLASLGVAPQTPEPSYTRAGDTGENPKLLAVRLMIEALTGKKVRLLSTVQLTSGQGASATSTPQLSPAQAPAAAAPPATAGWGVELTTTQTRTEAEQTAVAIEGTVQTAEGRAIEVAADLVMSRESVETRDFRFAAGDALRPQDPLVLNLTDAPAGLSERTVALDLEGDGDLESVPLLAPGSGYLVYDRNANGAVDGGGELFGPTRGDGFTELSVLDADGNGWIDEADPAFSGLRLWTADSGGRETLSTLLESGVGALSLGRVESPFAMKGADHQLRAQVRSTGLYLREDGGAGTIQQLDLVV